MAQRSSGSHAVDLLALVRVRAGARRCAPSSRSISGTVLWQKMHVLAPDGPARRLARSWTITE